MNTGGKTSDGPHAIRQAVPGLYIGSTTPYAGKNMLIAGLGLRFQKEGLNLGYMKPVGDMPCKKDGRPCDEDAFFVRDVLNVSLAPEEEELVSPALITQDFRICAFSGQLSGQSEAALHEKMLEDIEQAYARLSNGRDLMLVGGAGSVFSGRYCRLDGVSLIKRFGFKALIIDRMRREVDYDALLAAKDFLGEAMAGVVLNGVPAAFMTEVDGLIRPFLERNGISVLGVIPHDPLMGSIRIATLADGLGGKLVAAQSKGERMVENFLIGTMQVENFMTYFRRNPKSAVIVGGDRADIQLVAIEGDAAGLILTGNLYPNDIILARAEALNIPVIMVRDDTYNVARKMEQMLHRHKLRDVIKIRQGAQLVSSNLDVAALRQAMGV